jgi:hypothetical protein
MASEIIWEENGILFKRTGTVTDKEVIEANNRVFGDSRYWECRLFETLELAHDWVKSD